MTLSPSPRTILATGLLSLLAVALGCATAASHAPTQTWDQAQVTALAGQLETSARGLYSTLYGDPEGQMVGMEDEQNQMAGSVRELSETATDLHAKLQSGAGEAETQGAYKRIKELSRDVTEASGFTDMPADASGGKTALDALLGQLDGYYGAQ